MTVIIDRRKNLSEKSIINRKRFIQRSQRAIRKSVNNNISNKSIKEILDGDTVNIPIKDIDEPTFGNSSNKGIRDYVLNGNDVYDEDDLIDKPSGSGSGGSGNGASEDGEGDDGFQFTLSREEYLDIFFSDLELPDLLKKDLMAMEEFKPQRAGFSKSGSPSNINVEQSIKKSMGRRIALHRPTDDEIKELEEELERRGKYQQPTNSEIREYDELVLKIEELKNKQKRVPFIDDMDVRYNHYAINPVPSTRAVMFALMDVSGSMGEHEKNLAKRFFMLLYFFLTRHYEKVEIVYIRHTSNAEEVDEDTFFYDQDSGGTIVSSSLEKMLEIVEDRYPVDSWNIYGAQASDGDNWSEDNKRCKKILEELVLPMVQYFAYVQVAHEVSYGASGDGDLWATYTSIDQHNFSIKKVANANSIWTVFRELFEKRQTKVLGVR